MYLVYYISMVGIGAASTDWANDGLFGDGWHLFGIGTGEYEEVSKEYTNNLNAVNAFYELDTEAEDFDEETAISEMQEISGEKTSTIEVEDEETWATEELTVYYDEVPENADEDVVPVSYLEAVSYFEEKGRRFLGVPRCD